MSSPLHLLTQKKRELTNSLKSLPPDSIRRTHIEKLLLNQIELALKKVHLGTYGTCSVCEEEINPKRLKKNPESIMCVDCKESSEKVNGFGFHLRKPFTQWSKSFNSQNGEQ